MACSDGARLSTDQANRGNIEREDGSETGILDEDNVFEVEKIVGMTKVDGKALYRVRWLGYGPQSDTWEPYENLLTCKDLVEEYVEREQKKKKRSSGEKSVKKKRTNFTEKQDYPLEASPSNSSAKESDSNKQLKDTFWKDLEEGRINVFAEDMYSKVKGRSARHHNSLDDQSRKQRKNKTKYSYDDNSSDTSVTESKGKLLINKVLRKSRKRVLIALSSSDVSEEENINESQDHSSVPINFGGEVSVDLGEHISTIAEPSTSEVTAEVKSSTNGDRENIIMPLDLLKINNENTTTSINTMITEEHSEQDSNNNNNKTVQENENQKSCLPLQKENLTEVTKDTPSDDVTSIKSAMNHKEKNIPAPDSSEATAQQYSFEFSRYNPEEWIKKDAYDSRRVVELTNVQFRHAVKRGDYELLRRALNGSHRYNLEQPDVNGTTLLMIAALCGFDDIVELLVIHGANINACQRNGSTALMFASDLGHICCVAVLLGLGAHVDIQQQSGETSLMKACKKGYRQIVQLLLEYGANFAMVTNSDTTALKLAKLYDHPATESLLIDHISRVTAAFEAQVNITLNNTAHIVHALFPLHCFSLNEGNTFKINFNYQLQPPQAGVGMLLFIAHARITPQEVKCRFYGPCAVFSVLLNGVRQLSLTEEANFVLSFSPLRNGKNDLLINTVTTVSSKAKLLICAYKAQLNGNR